MTTENNIDRPHRFQVGDRVRHVDEVPTSGYEIVAQTWRIRDGVKYPTYTIAGEVYGVSEEVEDVLDTLDLESTASTSPCEVCSEPVLEGLRYMAGPLAGRMFCEEHDPLRGGPRAGFDI